MTESEALWRREIASKYHLIDKEWWPAMKGTVKFKGPWVSILPSCPEVEVRYKTKVGKEDKTMFWNNPWLLDELLSRAFPRLYGVAASKDLSVAQCWS